MNRFEQIKKNIAAHYDIDQVVFDKKEHVYLETESSFFQMISFGKNIIYMGDAQLMSFCQEQFGSLSPEVVMNSRNLYRLDTKLQESGYYLDGEHLSFIQKDHVRYSNDNFVKQGYYFQYFADEEIKQLYEYKNFENALTFNADKLAYAAFHQGELVAMAAADNRLGKMWQIGVDVLPAFRGKGLGAAVVQTLTGEIKRRGYIPYYTTWSGNLASLKIAINAGYSPLWVMYPSKKITTET